MAIIILNPHTGDSKESLATVQPTTVQTPAVQSPAVQSLTVEYTYF